MKQPFWNSFPLKTSNHICTTKQKLDSFQLQKCKRYLQDRLSRDFLMLQYILVTYSSVPNLKRVIFCCNYTRNKLPTVCLKGRMATILC